MTAMIREIDVRAALPAIHVPTLVIHRLSDRITPPFHGRYLASRIAGARYFEQPGDHSLRFAGGGDIDALFGEIAGFLAALLGLATGVGRLHRAGPQAAEGAEARAAPDPVPAGGDRSAAAAGARPVRRFAHNVAGYDTIEERTRSRNERVTDQ